jgi:hypothetical protein
VFGSDWAQAAKIDNNEKIGTRRRIRERMSAGFENGGQKAGWQPAECKDEFASDPADVSA